MSQGTPKSDDFSSYHAEFLEGQYDCTDRIVLNGYFSLGHNGGGIRHWWRQLTGSEHTLDQVHMQRMAGHFSRRVHAYAQKHGIPLVHCQSNERKHELAEEHRPQDPKFVGLFLILVAKAPALVWQVKPSRAGTPHLEAKKPWPYVNHYHFHIMDPDWGHITIKMSGHPPFGIQVMLNGHEWVERQARKQTISCEKEGNCFVGGSIQALDQIADTLRASRAIGRLARVCDRWVYSSCLCFGLTLEEQQRSGFRYGYSCYQLEYSRNLLFERGTVLDQVYQGLIDRTRRLLDMRKVRTLLGWKHRPHQRRGKTGRVRMEVVVDESAHDLTVFKIHFGPLTLKIYDKGARVLRIEAIAHNARGLRCGRSVEKLPAMLARLRQMTIDFLNTVQAAHHSFLDDGVLDALPQPTQRGRRRLAGVDLEKPRLRAISAALLALACQPGGFTTQELAAKLAELWPDCPATYTARQAAYDLSKVRGKLLAHRLEHSRRYQLTSTGIRTLSGLLILREKVIKPVLAGFGRSKIGDPPKTIDPLDRHYLSLQHEMRCTLRTLNLAA